MTDLSPETFRKLLAEKGIVLDDRAFAAALQGARHMKSEVARVAAYMDTAK